MKDISQDSGSNTHQYPDLLNDSFPVVYAIARSTSTEISLSIEDVFAHWNNRFNNIEKEKSSVGDTKYEKGNDDVQCAVEEDETTYSHPETSLTVQLRKRLISKASTFTFIFKFVLLYFFFSVYCSNCLFLCNVACSL